MNVEHLGDIEVAYRTEGSGDQTLVMIHGLGQDHRMWAELQANLSEYRTIAYDVRGHGGSTVGEGSGSLAQLGGDLIALLERFGPAVLLGFSLGGSIALWVAAERPDLVEGVAAVATSSVVGKAAAGSIEERIAIFEKGDAGEIYAQILEDTEAQLVSGESDAAAVSAERAEAVRDPRGYVNAARAIRGMREESLNDRLAEIAAPVLIVSGERDAWCPRRAAEIMLEHLPQGTNFEELAGVGHLVSEDAPDALTVVVREWLKAKENR